MPRLHAALWHVDYRLGGSGAPPPPFERLSRWAAAKLRSCGCATTGPNVGAGGGVIARWRYERASEPFEVLLHLTGTGGCCPHVGRAHSSQAVMMTVELLSGAAYIRCWDQTCTVKLPAGGHVKARQSVGCAPSGTVPCAYARVEFEHAHEQEAESV